MNASLEELYIPSSVEELEEGWCKGISKLKNVKISSKNNFFKICENSFIVGKTNKKSDKFDCIIFAHRDIKHAFIPQSIRTIGSLSFTNCKELKKIDFQRNLELASIGKQAFSWSSIRFISIPESCRIIGEHAFSGCTNLKKIEFTEYSKLELIDESSFSGSSIETIKIPSNVFCINESAFRLCRNMKKIEFQLNSKLVKIEKYAFADSSLKNIVIPTSVKSISNNTFYNCTNLKSIEFLGNGRFESSIITNCENLLLISFPNSCLVNLNIVEFNCKTENFSLFILNKCYKECKTNFY